MEKSRKKYRRLRLTSWEYRKNVIFTGTRSDVNELMQAMDMFVFPSLYEGLPVTMIEAQAAGLPCVISDYVSEECIVTSELISVMKLSDSVEMWAELCFTKSESLIEEILQKKLKKLDMTLKLLQKSWNKFIWKNTINME